ncbi:MAG TPA: cytochrome b/b6 domain-containing protein [Casimicrobiaceae bacterium]|nr:cytochrome b/b6 domain-containing protein [Casimicrobiaceae bacterium]
MEKIRILVWDLPVRVFHWLLAISFAGAYATSGYDRLRYIHVTFGYTVAVLIAFRLMWAIVGTRYARLSSFSYGPHAVRAYLGSLLARKPRHYVGHNPAGSWAIYAIVTLGILTTGAGYARDNHLVGKWIDDVHEVAGNVMLAVVVAHIAGVLVSSLLHRENLAKSMLTGYKSGHPGEAIRRTRWVTAVLLAGFIAAFWSGAVEIPGLPRTHTVKADAGNPAAMRSDRVYRRRESRERGS